MRIGSKGIEIPVNLLVILAISIIVLLSIVVFFVRGFTPGSQNLAAQQDFSNCATAYVRTGCSPAGDYVAIQSFLCSSAAGDTLEKRANAANIRGECNIKKAAGCSSSTYPVGCDSSTSTGASTGSSGSSGSSGSGSSAPPGFGSGPADS